MERQVKELDCCGQTIYRLIERRSPQSPWMVVLPCIDWDRKEDAEWKLKEIERIEHKRLARRWLAGVRHQKGGKRQ